MVASAAPVSRPRWSTGASITSTSITRAVEAIDEWASAEAAMRQRAGRSRPAAVRASAAAWRAATSALRLPAEPPDTKQPPVEAGMPARSAIQRRASFSACTAPEPSSQDPP